MKDTIKNVQGLHLFSEDTCYYLDKTNLWSKYI